MRRIFLLLLVFSLSSVQSYCKNNFADSLNDIMLFSKKYYKMVLIPEDSSINLSYQIVGYKDFDNDGLNELMIKVFVEEKSSDTYLFFVAKKIRDTGIYKICLSVPIYFNDELGYFSGDVSIKNDKIYVSEHLGRNYGSYSVTTIVYRNNEFVVINYNQMNYNYLGGNEYISNTDFENMISSHQVWLREFDLDTIYKVLYKPLYSTYINEKVTKTYVSEKEFIISNNHYWRDSSDLSYRMFSQWDSSNVYLTVEVKDDTLIFFNKELLGMDYIECWFDFSDCLFSKKINETCVDSNLIKIQFKLINNGSYNKISTNVNDITYDLSYICQKNNDGYSMIITFPKKFFNHVSLSQKQNTLDKFDFTLLVSDSDNPKNRTQHCIMASSQLQNFIIPSLGILVITDKYYLPTFYNWEEMKNKYVKTIR